MPKEPLHEAKDLTVLAFLRDCLERERYPVHRRVEIVCHAVAAPNVEIESDLKPITLDFAHAVVVCPKTGVDHRPQARSQFFRNLLRAKLCWQRLNPLRLLKRKVLAVAV